MLRINLVPQEIQRKAEELPPLVFGIPPLVVVLVAAGLYFSAFSQAKKLKNEVAAVEQELAKYSGGQGELNQERNRLQRIIKRIEFIKDARRRQGFWTEAIGALASTLPPGSVLENLSIGPSGQMTMTGRTSSFAAVADMLAAFSRSERFSVPQLTSANKTYTAEGVEAEVSFQVTVNYLSPADQQEAAEEPAAEAGAQQGNQANPGTAAPAGGS